MSNYQGLGDRGTSAGRGFSGGGTLDSVVPTNPILQHLAGIKTPGYTPDYATLLQNDPGLMAIRNQNKFNLAEASNLRNATMSKLNYAYQGAGNRFSSLQQLSKQLQDSIFHGTMADAARGALHSGEQPWMIQNANYAHDLGKYDAGRQYEDQINSALQSYLQTAQGAAQSESQGISDASDRMASNPIHQPTEGFAAYDEALSQQHGAAIYKDLSGNMWTTDASGNTVPFQG